MSKNQHKKRKKLTFLIKNLNPANTRATFTSYTDFEIKNANFQYGY